MNRARASAGSLVRKENATLSVATMVTTESSNGSVTRRPHIFGARSAGTLTLRR